MSFRCICGEASDLPILLLHHFLLPPIQLFYPLPPSSAFAVNLSKHQGLCSESALCIRWPKYWSFGIIPSNEYFRIDFLYDLRVWSPFSPRDSQESSPASQFKGIILQSSAFFMVQLSHLYMTTGKTIALTFELQIFVGKVMFLLFNMLSRFVTAFLPKSKYLLTSWLQSPSAVIWEPKKIKAAEISFCVSVVFLPFLK